ncbi:MAG: aminoacetone oxidase family FAD-binding enzyme, partial [Christensenellales bacterium]
NYNGYNNPVFAKLIISGFDVDKTLDFFDNVGLKTYSDAEGRVYPVTDSANSVLDVLRFEIEILRVNVLCSSPVEKLIIDKNKPVVFSNGVGSPFDSVIVCAGGIVPSGELFTVKIAKTPIYPSLCPLVVNSPFIKGLAGTRVKVRISLNGGEYTESGEILFKNYGLSGIPIFNISSKIAANFRKNITRNFVSIDFFPEIDVNKLKDLLIVRLNKYNDPERMFVGLTLNKIAHNLLTEFFGKIPSKAECMGRISDFIAFSKNVHLPVSGLSSLGEGQVMSGGYEVSELNQDLSLKKYPCVFLAGEIIDIDGLCGGYNLQWAWSSGVVAARSAIRYMKNAYNQ